jgi:uncharacterized protein YndB with AHSA1/START domain
MGHEFEATNEITVDATPEQVWEAVATGPGIDAWFMGRNEVEPRLGGRARMVVGDFFTAESTVTAWEPPHRFAHRTDEAPDGSFMAFEFLIEGRGEGTTVIRLVHSGFLPGDDWEAEYDSVRKGDAVFLRTLAAYLTYFPGRVATPVTAWGNPQPSQEQVWEGHKRALGISGPVREGDAARFTLPGSGPVDGVVDAVLEPNILGVRTEDGLFRFEGRQGAVGVGHHIFANVDEKEATAAWQAWLNEHFA